MEHFRSMLLRKVQGPSYKQHINQSINQSFSLYRLPFWIKLISYTSILLSLWPDCSFLQMSFSHIKPYTFLSISLSNHYRANSLLLLIVNISHAYLNTCLMRVSHNEIFTDHKIIGLFIICSNRNSVYWPRWCFCLFVVFFSIWNLVPKYEYMNWLTLDNICLVI